MKKRNFACKLTCIALSAFLFMSVSLTELSYKTSVLASESQETSDQKYSFNNAAIDSGFVAPLAGDVTDSGIALYSDSGNLARAAALPASYDSRTYGNVTSVKYQGNLGICWSYAAVACMESYALSHGYVDSPDDIDLSEYALAYMTYNDEKFEDPLGGTDGDVTTYSSKQDGSKYTVEDVMSNGGNDNIAFKTLSKWAAIVNETDATRITSVDFCKDIDVQQKDISYILTGQYYINIDERDNVKRAIVDNGAVSILYNSAESYEGNSYSDSWKQLYHYTYDNTAIDHAVAVVGWNDNIDKSNFSFKDSTGKVRTPEGNGAWLIKNSWSTTYGDNGYMWVSYYDSSIAGKSAAVYEIAPADTYKNNYQYDGSTVYGWGHYSWAESSKYANVFKVAGNDTSKELLKAVSFALEDANRSYSIQIYKNPQTDKPESGTPLLSQPLAGNTTYAGYYTIPLSKPVALDKGDSFAVVITFNQKTVVEQTVSKQFVGACAEAYNEIADNQSYFYDEYWNSHEFMDTYSNGIKGCKINFCIKAFTDSYSDIVLSDLKDAEVTRGTELSPLSVNITNAQAGEVYTYQWYVSDNTYENGTLIEGAVSNTYTPSSDSNGVKYYYCSVTNNGTHINTNRAKITVRTDVSSLQFGAIDKCTYNGKAQTPSITVKDGDKTLVLNEDYTVQYSNNTEVGTATVKVVGVGDYKGNKTMSFVIEKAPAPTQITSNEMAVNQSSNTVSSVAVSTQVKDVVSSLNEKSYCVVVKNGSEVPADSLAATGMEIRLMDGNKITKTYSLIVTGDTNGDGQANIVDMIAVKRKILGSGTLNGVYLKAGDTNGDGVINIVDFVRVKSYILKKGTLPGVSVN